MSTTRVVEAFDVPDDVFSRFGFGGIDRAIDTLVL